MAKKKNNGIDDMQDKLDGLFIKSLDVFDTLLENIKAGEVPANGHTLNSIVGFLEKNQALMPAIRQRRQEENVQEQYKDLPTFDDDEYSKPRKLTKQEEMERLYGNLPSFEDD